MHKVEQQLSRLYPGSSASRAVHDGLIGQDNGISEGKLEAKYEPDPIKRSSGHLLLLLHPLLPQ
jgi:hypothetical protein